ncbi:MAG TPA: anti-sigma factor, partial [Candidatus Limnocylindrales bacterium]|nr:anti-sigma factor [Candidatus Limnocylindrales bacterium]
MDHEEVQELLQDAAVEPGGLERLMAGDTPNAAVVAGHLAGCAECGEELERLRRTVGVVRPAVRAGLPPELRQRTLDYVAAVGRPRGATAGAALTSGAAVAPARLEPVVGAGIATVTGARGNRARWSNRRLRSLAALAAALIIAITGTAVIVGGQHDSVERLQSAEIEALGDVARWTLRVDRQPDVRRIALAATAAAPGSTGSPTSADLVFSPSSTELVVVAQSLTPAPAGHEYRCWVEVDGHRRPIGKMFFGGQLAYWVGDVPAVSGLPAGARFGVSLVDRAAAAEPGEPILV